MTPAEQMWKKFMEHLAEVDSIGKGNPPHQSFLGSVTKYKRIFLEANREQETRPTE